LKNHMDPDQLKIILQYAVIVSVASLVLQHLKPQWTRIRIAFITGGLLPLLGLALTAFAFVRWLNAPPLPHDTDHHAMAVIGILIVLFLSVICLVVGMVVSLLVTTIARMASRTE